MGRCWVGNSANEAPLECVLRSIRLRGGDGQGKIIIVRGEAGAGASAFASRLHTLLSRINIRSAFVPRSPFNADFLFSSHLLKSLGLPSSSFDIAAGRRVTRHYEAAMHLRGYQAVICEDAHDFFHKHQMKKENIYESIHRLTMPPYSYIVVLCGLRDPLTVVGDSAMAYGMDVEYVDLRRMRLDQSYLAFVRGVAMTITSVGSYPSLQPFLLPIRATLLPADEVAANQAGNATPSPVSIPNPMDSEISSEDTQLGAGSFIALSPCPLSAEGLDVGILHAHTKGLVGNTASVVKGLLASWLAPSTGVIPRSASSTAIPANSAQSTLSDLPLLSDQEGPAMPAGRVEDTDSSTKSSNGVSQRYGEPASSVELTGDRSGYGVGALFLGVAGQPDPHDAMQLALPFLICEARQLEVQLELGFENPPERARAASDIPIAADEVHAISEEESLWSATSEGMVSNHPISSSSSSRPKRYRLFFGYLTPVHDETLGSWLSRNATSSTASTFHEGFLEWCTGLLKPTATPFAECTADDFTREPYSKTAAIGAEDAIQPPWNPEVLLGNPRTQDQGQEAKDLEYDDLYRSEAFLQAFGGSLGAHLAGRFKLPSNAVSDQYNLRFGAQCLADDITAMRAPGLRRAWRNRGAALCVAHRQPVLLQQLDKGNLSELSGAWQAYMQQTLRGYFDHGVGLISRLESGYQSALKEARVCRIVCRIQQWVEYAPAFPYGRQPSKYALYFLLGVFLYQGNLVSEGGVARWFLKGPRGFKLDSHEYEKPTVVQMVKNIESASPRSLALAYLFLGLACDRISKEENDLLRRAFVFTDCLFPGTREELKTLAQCFQPYQLDAIWESALRNLQIDDLVQVAWLLRDR